MAQFGATFRLTLLTDDPALAAQGEAAGIDRIGADLERLGKAERQAGHNTRVSDHTFDGLARVAAALSRAQVFARLNPPNDGSGEEIETALACGARVLMLPYFETAEQVARFARLVRGRATLQLLVETVASARDIEEIAAVPGVDEVMIGLNDLRLQMGVANHFQALVSPLVERVATAVRRRGLPLSMGGVGRIDDTALPVPADLVLAQYPRLGATGALVARALLNNTAADFRLDRVIAAIRDRLDHWAAASPDALEQARMELTRRAAAWRPAST